MSVFLALLVSLAFLAGLLMLINYWGSHADREPVLDLDLPETTKPFLAVDSEIARASAAESSSQGGDGLPEASRHGSLHWIPADLPIQIAGRCIKGGMVYVGSGARAARGLDSEPAMIDSALPINWYSPDSAGVGVRYWPSYSSIPPESRAAYLSWLDSNRADPNVCIGYVFLYFYGLERRVLVDAKLDGKHPDIPIIATEVRRLLAVYGSNGSFRSYASSFIDMIEAISIVDLPPVPPDSESLERHWEVPLVIRLGLGHFVSEGKPIPAEWALAFLRTHPETTLRTPASRCIGEFEELFRRKYRARFNDGLVVRPPRNTIEFSYRPASSGFGGGAYRAAVGDWPDITRLAGPINKLREIGAECTDALDAYSRHLGRHPDAEGTAPAVGLLPEELLETHGGQVVEELRTWTSQVIAKGRPVAAPIEQLLARWAPGRVEKLTKTDAVSLASLLGKLGIGIEPDVRFGGSTPKPGSMIVVFPLPIGATETPSPQHSAAATLVHLCAVVASADGSVTEDERHHLAIHLEEVLGLDVAEKARLEARFTWLLAVSSGLGGLKKRVDCLDPDRRAAVGRFLVDIAAIDGSVTPDEITTLTKLYRLLGLDEQEVYRAIHTLGTDDTAPVTVRAADSAEPRWAIPAPGDEPDTMVRLDAAKVRARLADTATVSALLAEIFADSADQAAQSASPGESKLTAPPTTTEGTQLIPGLDGTHSDLARRLCGRPAWSRVVAEDLASGLGLPLIDGAIDRINEAVIGVCGEPLIEGDDPLEINDYAAKGVH